MSDLRAADVCKAAALLPADLVELPQWCLWRWERIDGRQTKKPYRPDGRAASSTNPSDWALFEEVVEALGGQAHRSGRYSGLGFVFVLGGGLVGIDLDDCIDTAGHLKPWAQGICQRFSDTYSEISPSGRGIKIWARGSLPANLPGVPVGDGSVELYDHSRYFTVTGKRFGQAPLQLADHSDDLKLLHEHLSVSVRNVKSWPLQPLDGGRIPHGQQHNTLVSIAGTLRARRVCDEAILACLLAVNEHQCERPGTVEHIARIVRSTRAWRPA